MPVYDIAAGQRYAQPVSSMMEGKAARIALKNNAAIAEMNETAAKEDRPGQELDMQKRRLELEAARLDAQVSAQYQEFLQEQQEAAKEQQRNQWAQGYMAWQGAMEQGNEEAANAIVASTLMETGAADNQEELAAQMEMARTIGPERFFKSRFYDVESVLKGEETNLELKEVYDPESPTGTRYASEADAVGMPSPKKAPLVSMGTDLGDPPSGYAWKRDQSGNPVIGENGAPQLVPIEGGPAEKPTERERTAGYAAQMMQDMDQAISEMVSDNPDFDPTGYQAMVAQANNAVSFPEYRQFRAAADEWTSNMVFLRSGATARQEEKDAAFQNYFPQPWDDEATVEFKRTLRQQAMNRALALGDRGISGKEKPEDLSKQPMFVRGDETVSWDEIVETAKKHRVSPAKVMEDLGISQIDE